MLLARVRAIDLLALDRVLAVLLTVAAAADASSQLHRWLFLATVVSLVAITGSVAWRRVNPWLTTVVAITGFMAFQLASGYAGSGAFEVAAIALNFYLLGRRVRSGERTWLVAVFAYWLVGAAVIASEESGASIGAVLDPWAFVGGLPFLVGRTLESRRTLTLELQASTLRLAAAQEDRARRAAAEERNRMARELHDVIAHDVSVMVLQSSGARGIAGVDLERARAALQVVESAGRDALVELRRIVGVLHRGGETLPSSAAPGLSQLDVLMDRARGAGLPVELNVVGQLHALSPGLDLVAYRVVQEALTNAIKHAGEARAQVSVSVGARFLKLEVSDNGNTTPPHGEDREPGHGLVGMRERVELYGGELRAQRRPDGSGFEVHARIPLDGIVPSPYGASAPPRADESMATADSRSGWRWLDPAFAGVLLVALEIATLTDRHSQGPLVLNVLIVAVMALAAAWRRRSPLWFVLLVGVLASAINAYLTPLDRAPLLAAYLLIVVSYTAAAWLSLRQAAMALALLLGGTAISELGARHQPVGNAIGATLTLSAAWAAGRTIRARRSLVWELRRTAARLTAEREDRAQLAIAGERSRIASELHALVARSVAAMIVQAEGARSTLVHDQERADAAMGAIEDAGRHTLSDMRRILGVLRHVGDRGELEPQPGVAQVYALIQLARERGQPVELTVDGEPGTLPAGVDLGVYRILEDALESVRRQPVSAVGVALRFREQDLELQLTARCQGPSRWPTDAMRERIALCDGALDPELLDEEGWRFTARMPRGVQGAYA